MEDGTEPATWKDYKLPLDSKNRIRISNSYVPEFLEFFHEYLGHPGTNKMQETLREFYYFEKFYKEVEKHCASCLPCAPNKPNYVKRDELVGFLSYAAPKEKISTDIYGPLTGTEFNRTETFYILTITDIFTRFTVFVALSEISSESVYVAVKTQWFGKYSAPRQLISDNGPQYIGLPFRKLCLKNNVKHILCSPFDPTANGISERLNQTLGLMFRLGIGKNVEEVLQKAGIALNCTTHKATGVTSEQGFFGRSSIDPLRR